MVAILAIETSTEACSAALWIDDEITSRYVVAPQQHAKLILPMCDELLAISGLSPQQLSAVAFGKGPGSFTGVRIAAAVTQGIAFAHDLPVIPISSLQALAYDAMQKHHVESVLAAMDARMGEVYWGMFHLQHNQVVLLGEEQLVNPSQLTMPQNGLWFGAGSAWQAYYDQLQSIFNHQLSGIDAAIFPSATAVAALAAQMWHKQHMVSASDALPVYLRNKVVSG